VVDEGVDEGVEEVVGSEFSDSALGVSDAVSDGLEDVALLFLEGDDVVGSEDEAELFARDSVFFGVVGEHFHDDVELVLVLVDFWSLGGMDDVFEE